jgi:elongation factor P hydroxylase
MRARDFNPTTVRFQRPLLEQATAYAQETGIPRNRLIGIALQEFLERRTIGLTQAKTPTSN